ncbi:MAG: hypothetical protein Q8L06_15730 [Pseudohongiella sp.]|nr:hypothetical protein [Pseudohongiella sp.]
MITPTPIFSTAPISSAITLVVDSLQTELSRFYLSACNSRVMIFMVAKEGVNEQQPIDQRTSGSGVVPIR